MLRSAASWQSHPALSASEPSFRGADGAALASANPVSILGTPSWTEQKFVADDGAAADQFGWAIAVVDDTAYVGAPFAAVNGNARQGAVYVYAKVDGVWTQVHKLTASDGGVGESFGAAISVHGATMLIAANRATINGNVDQGAVYVFNQSGSSWNEAQKLVADDGAAADDFGYALKVEGGTAIIGAPFVNDRQGAAYVFRLSGGSWTQTQKLIPSDTALDQLYGAALAFEGSKALVGALAAAINGNPYQGAVYALAESSGSWSETQKIVAGDGVGDDRFGTAVALSDGTALISAIGATINDNEGQGAAYLFSDADGSWSQSGKIVAGDGAPNNNYGYSVALRGDTALVGAPFAAMGENAAQGAAYVYARAGGAWDAGTKFVAGDGATFSLLGWSSALDENLVFLGAIGTTVNGSPSQGAIYAYAAVPADGIFCSGFEDGESGVCVSPKHSRSE